MKTFHTFIGGLHEGPYNSDQLKEKQINSDTLVLINGATKWVTAVEVEELKELFNDGKTSDDYSMYEHEYAKVIWIIIFGIGILFCLYEGIKMIKK